MDNRTEAKPQTLADLLDQVQAHDRLLAALKECGMTGTAFEIEAQRGQRKWSDLVLRRVNLRQEPYVYYGQLVVMGYDQMGGCDAVRFAPLVPTDTVPVLGSTLGTVSSATGGQDSVAMPVDSREPFPTLYAWSVEFGMLPGDTPFSCGTSASTIEDAITRAKKANPSHEIVAVKRVKAVAERSR